jgi:hypothetical protein
VGLKWGPVVLDKELQLSLIQTTSYVITGKYDQWNVGSEVVKKLKRKIKKIVKNGKREKITKEQQPWHHPFSGVLLPAGWRQASSRRHCRVLTISVIRSSTRKRFENKMKRETRGFNKRRDREQGRPGSPSYPLVNQSTPHARRASSNKPDKEHGTVSRKRADTRSAQGPPRDQPTDSCITSLITHQGPLVG